MWCVLSWEIDKFTISPSWWWQCWHKSESKHQDIINRSIKRARAIYIQPKRKIKLPPARFLCQFFIVSCVSIDFLFSFFFSTNLSDKLQTHVRLPHTKRKRNDEKSSTVRRCQTLGVSPREKKISISTSRELSKHAWICPFYFSLCFICFYFIRAIFRPSSHVAMLRCLSKEKRENSRNCCHGIKFLAHMHNRHDESARDEDKQKEKYDNFHRIQSAISSHWNVILIHSDLNLNLNFLSKSTYTQKSRLGKRKRWKSFSTTNWALKTHIWRMWKTKSLKVCVDFSLKIPSVKI